MEGNPYVIVGLELYFFILLLIVVILLFVPLDVG